MKALVYHGPGQKSVDERPKPTILEPGDAVVKILKTTICGTDLHILKGDVPTCTPGRILGHEGVGVVEAVGSAVRAFKPGDHVIISCISACGTCDYCRRGMYSHCRHGGWILGNKIDGTQAEYVRTPHADTSLYHVPPGTEEEALVMLSDILPTGFECGVLNGKVEPGSTVAIVGAGPIGLAALLTAQFYSPAEIIMIDLDDNRLEVAARFGATSTINNADGKAVENTWPRRRHGDRGGRRPRDLCDLRRHHRPWRHHRQCRRARRQGRPASGETVGSQHRDHDAAGRHRDDADAAQDGTVEETRAEAADHPSLQTGPDPRCL